MIFGKPLKIRKLIAQVNFKINYYNIIYKSNLLFSNISAIDEVSGSQYEPSEYDIDLDSSTGKRYFYLWVLNWLGAIRKERYGNRIDGPWIFGLALCKVDENNKRWLQEVRYFYVARRDKETLTRIIKNEVIPGSTIFSDEWSAYNSLSSFGFNHIRINHSIEYVNNGFHTNTIEACWGRLKTKFLRIKRGSHLKI